ncbi:gamma-glutamyltranspeptidase 1-like protein, partial [Euroglyphus maynei]
MLHPKFHHLYPNAKDNYDEAVLFYHRLMEAFKFAYSRRMHLGDDRFDNCTKFLSELTSQDYIDKIVEKINDTTTYGSKSGFYDVDICQMNNWIMEQHTFQFWINMVMPSHHRQRFGSKVISPSTGLILNDQMDDFNTGKTNAFDLPPAFANTVAAGKRPLSSMSPSVFADETGPRLIIGASGGSKITTSVAL